MHEVQQPKRFFSRRDFLLGGAAGAGTTAAAIFGAPRLQGFLSGLSPRADIAYAPNLPTTPTATPEVIGTPTPYIDIKDEGRIIEEGADLLSQKELARVAKRVDDFTYIAETFIQEPFRAGLFRRTRDIPENDLSALMGATYPREARSHINFTVLDGVQSRYVLDITNDYNQEDLIRSSVQLDANPRRNPEVKEFVDPNGQIADNQLVEFAKTVFRVPEYASWGSYIVIVEGRNLHSVRAGGISPIGSGFNMEVNSFGQGAFILEYPFLMLQR